MLQYHTVNHSPQAGTLFSCTHIALLERLEPARHGACPISRFAPSTEEHTTEAGAGTFGLARHLDQAIITTDLQIPPDNLPSSLACNNGGIQSKTPNGVRYGPESLATQQRHLLKMTDKVLLKRSEVRHQQGNVDTCRNFLKSSTMELWHENELTFGKQQTKRKKKNKVGKDIERLDALPPVLSKFPSTIHDHGGNGDVNPSGFKTTDDPLFGLETTAAPKDTESFKTLFGQYRSDYQTLMKEEEVLKAMNDELSNLEYHLAEQHRFFSKCLRSTDFAQQLCRAIEKADLEPSSSVSEGSRSESDTPSLIEQYFDQKGNVGVYRERLQELEYHFQEGLLEREFIVDRGDTLDVSDETFNKTYNARRAEIEEDIDLAVTEANTLAERCLDAGLEIDKYRRNGPSVRAPSTTHNANSIPDVYSLGEVASGDDTLRNPVTEWLPHAREPSSRTIGKWLHSVADHVNGNIEVVGNQLGSEGSPFNHPESPVLRDLLNGNDRHSSPLTQQCNH